MREKVILVCTVCLSRNYRTTKTKFSAQDRLVMNKFCKKCNQHTLHRESK